MVDLQQRDVFIDLVGQDDNLGDSVLRDVYLRVARGHGHRMHVLIGQATPDYVSGLTLQPEDRVYTSRARWIDASEAIPHAVHVLNAGEVALSGATYPMPPYDEHLERAQRSGATVIAAGMGLRHPEPGRIDFKPAVREAAVVAWRDAVSCAAAGFGEVAPDWAFADGTPTADWLSSDQRDLLAVTLRFDRPWPGPEWVDAVRDLAASTGSQIVTVAQVARDAPRAVRLAEMLGGDYLVAPSTRHDDLNAHVRAIYQRSVAVVSDRAHGLIIAATEGAVPLGSAADPEKVARMLAVVGLDGTVGRYDQLRDLGARLGDQQQALAPALDAARQRLADLEDRIHAALAVAR